MKKTLGRCLGSGILLGLAALLFLFPGESSQAARRGVTLCLDLIIPSLFPFFVLSSLSIATGMADALAGLLARPMGALFGIRSGGTSALILGAIGGYPTGASALAQLVERGACSQQEARRLALFCNNCGPAFFIGAAGVGIFGSRDAGILLLVCNLLAAILIGAILHLLMDPKSCKAIELYRETKELSLFDALPDCVRAAFSSTLNVSAYVILFSVLTALADCSGLLPLAVNGLADLLPRGNWEPLLRSFLIGSLEISTGTASLSQGVDSPAALPLAAFLLGWGGLSVHCQSLPFLTRAGVSLGPYLAAKLVQGSLSAGLAALGAWLFPLSLPVMAPVAGFGSPSLMGREILALWLLAGLYCLLTYKKRVEKRGKRGYNRAK